MKIDICSFLISFTQQPETNVSHYWDIVRKTTKKDSKERETIIG